MIIGLSVAETFQQLWFSPGLNTFRHPAFLKEKQSNCDSDARKMNSVKLQNAGSEMSATLTCSSSQLAQGQDGSFRRFAVLEFATAEMAEEARRLADGRLLAGTNIRVSFCAPGVPGRSMLAALIAAQTMVLLYTDKIHYWSF